MFRKQHKGFLEKRRNAVAAMHKRWLADEKRLQELFESAEEFSDGTEMLRNLGSAIAHAGGFLSARSQMTTDIASPLEKDQ